MVELRPALGWTCDDCGRDSYVNLIMPELSPEELAKLEKSGARKVDIKAPDKVKCPHCKTEFATGPAFTT